MRSTQKVPGAPARCQTSFPIALKLLTKTFLIGSIIGYDVTPLQPIQKPSETQKPKFLGQAIQEPIFPVSDAGFEGGDDGRGCFD